MKLSYREKVILMVVVALLTLAIGYFTVISPKLTTISQTKASLSQKQTEKLDVDKKIQTADEINKKLKVTYDEDKKLSDFFMPEVNTYEVDQFLQDKLNANNLKVKSLELTGMKATDLSFYIPAGEHPVYALQVAADLNGTLPSDYLTKDQAGTAAPKACEKAALSVAKIDFSGSVNDFKNFLDTIDKLDKSVIVSGVSVEDFTKPVIDGSVTINIYSLSALPEMK